MRLFLQLLALVLLFSPIQASAAPEPKQAVHLIETTFSDSVEAVRREQEAISQDPRVAYRLITELLSPHIDFKLISQLVLGPHWRSADEAQRERFVSAFQESLLRTYAVALQEHIGEVEKHLDKGEQLLKVHPLPPGVKGRRVIVRSELRLGGQPIAIDYRLYAREDGWKVYDVVIENVSFVANYRTEYNGILQRSDLDDLIAQLEARNAKSLRDTEVPQHALMEEDSQR